MILVTLAILTALVALLALVLYCHGTGYESGYKAAQRDGTIHQDGSK